MHKAILTMISLAIAALVGGCGSDTPADNGPSSVAVIGDMPYGTSPTDTSQFLANPTFIAAINKDTDVSLVAHVGDLHSGKEFCTDTYDRAVFSQWSAFRMPVVYTPGDNEWADCHKVKQGGGSYNAATGLIDLLKDAAGKLLSFAGGDPAANLDLVRSIYFSAAGKSSVGGMSLHSQAQEFDAAFPADAKYVENAWWIKSGVLFVTVNVPGGSNNDADIWYGAPTMSASQSLEVSNRSAANKRWLDTAFRQATANGAAGVVILLQADMWDIDGNAAGAAHLSGYKQFIDVIATDTKAFGKPVLLFNGDSHVYRSDNPLVPGATCVIEPSAGAAAVPCTVANQSAGSNNPADPYLNQPNGYNVPNLRRVVVHGGTTPLEYLKLMINPAANAANGPDAFGPFSWKRVAP